jgi:hypothetical protein
MSPTQRRPVRASGASDAVHLLAPVRYMTVVAQDPCVRRGEKILTAKVAVPAEDLVAGPLGYRVHVVDYDASARRFYGTHSLPAGYDDEPAQWRDGDPAIVDDFRFHAQNVYALVMRTLARFEFALGRRLGWSFGTHQIKVAPHGMVDANAFYSPMEEGLVFGCFHGRSGKPVYTCLSNDIVVHETTHALLDALRERYLDPSNPDQAAFHEGFADVIALLSVFSQPEVVKHLLQPQGGNGKSPALIGRDKVSPDALRQSALFGLAEEMGKESGSIIRAGALRQSTTMEPDPKILESAEFGEPHRRGEVFVAAVLRGFIEAWSQRIIDSGLQEQRQYPIAHVAEDGADIADALITMWIRAIDYMPPVHLEFGDALSGALTADGEVRPDDSRYRLREHMLQQFRLYGIEPASKRARPLGTWERAPQDLSYDRVRFESMRSDKDEVFRFLWENRKKLELRTGAHTQVLSVRPCVRTEIDGFLLRETMVQYYQVARLTPSELKEVGITAPADYLEGLRKAERRRRAPGAPAEDAGAQADAAADGERDATTPLYGGGLLIFDEYGRLKYWVHNDVFGSKQSERLKYLWTTGQLEPRADRARYRAERLSTLHRLRAIDARRSPGEGW